MNSNETPDNITLNSCQYTPVYLIQNNSITQARSYNVLAPPLKQEPRPVTNNLKLFYENSGNLENGLIVNNVQYVSNTPAPKQIQELPGNNLKLASFLVPKRDANKQQYIATISNKILKPTKSSSDTNVLPNINIITPKVNGARNKANNAPRTLLKPRILPKITPKEKTPEPTKHTSVQLLKLGGTYHSLNKLSSEQMRLVSKALEGLQGLPGRPRARATFDADSNTRIVYKVVSPNELKVIGKNKILLKTSAAKKVEAVKAEPEPYDDDDEEPTSEVVNEVKVTRSGRTVKLPRHIQVTQEDPPPKTKKKTTTFSCFTCSVEFASMYRLQRHYDNRPGHIPANVHSNLFHCLLTMTQHSGAPDKAAVFIQQLEQLVERLRALLPCLLHTMDGVEGTPCSVNDDVGRLFGMNPGVYNLNVDALACKKDSEGHCPHNPKPSPSQFTSASPFTAAGQFTTHDQFTADGQFTTPGQYTDDGQFTTDGQVNCQFTITGEFTDDSQFTTSGPFAAAGQFPTSGGRFLPPGGQFPTPDGQFPTPDGQFPTPDGQFPSPGGQFPSPGHISPEIQPSQLWLSKQQEEPASLDNDGEDCARINSVDKWAKNRVWKHKLEKTESKQANKKMKLNSDSGECLIELGSEVCDAVTESIPKAVLEVVNEDDMTVTNESRSLPMLTESPIHSVDLKRQKGSHKQFYSTHFDIRSSPIKPSSAVFSKFQIVPEKIPSKFEAQLLRPLTFETNNQSEETSVQNRSESSLDLNGIFKELSPNMHHSNVVAPDSTDHVSCKESDVLNNISFDNPKEWTLSETSEPQQPNSLIVPAMMHVKDVNSTFNDNAINYNDNSMNNNDNSVNNNDDMMADSRLSLTQGVSVLNFLETLGNELTCPETELRNNSMDFPLDLFSFNHA